MKNIKAIIIVCLVILFGFPDSGLTQENSNQNIWFDVMRVYPTPTLKRDTLEDAKTIKDINKYYKPIWIREFISTEISTIHDGEVKVAKGLDDVLTKEQKRNMETADPKSEISVVIDYIPENTLKYNEPKKYDFSFSVDADEQASYVSGTNELLQYIEKKAVVNIDEALFEGRYNLAAVKFSIDVDGQIVDAHIFETSDDESVDKLLLETVCNMPIWKPAQFSTGLKTKQEFVLAVGNRESCTMNLLYVK